MRLTPLPYQPDSAARFDAIADEPWSIFLDSGRPGTTSGRFDILAGRPWATLVARAGVTEIWRHGEPLIHSESDPFELIRGLLGARAAHPDIPFAGGAIGYFAYELGARLHPSLPRHRAASCIPDMAVGLYGWAVVIDHVTRVSHLVASMDEAVSDQEWRELTELFSTAPKPRSRTPFRATSEIVRHFPRDDYRAAFERLRNYIQDGDCYQANLAQRFSVPVKGDSWLAYQKLRRLSPTPHAAYLNLPFGRILSASPERFMEARDGRVATTPIKGTRRRGLTPSEDKALARELLASAKDRAENLMIVDLLRNDLGKVCVSGSIEVPRLFEIESYSNVHHLVSTVTGRLAPGEDALSALRAAFPGGSITGAPKRRAMEIIAELEPAPRGVYCGCIGYIGDDGGMDCNIAIRTLTWRNGRAEFSAGGGIVADSDPNAEYQECLDKAEPIFRLFEDTGDIGATSRVG